MAKKNAVQPVVVELTEEQKAKREEQRKFSLLVAINNELRNTELEDRRAKFVKAVENFKQDGQMSYDIKWNGYAIMVAEKLEANLHPFRTFMDGKTVADLPAIEEEVSKQMAAVMRSLLHSSWLIEWDSSTCAMANQEHKAEARALQMFGERLQRMQMFFGLKKELV